MDRPAPTDVTGLLRVWADGDGEAFDGERVYFPHTGDERPPREIGLLLGWRALLQH
jgi:hypothetical protein